MPYFFGLLNKCCIFKGFIFSTVFLLGQFYSPGTSVSTVLHYYHIMLSFYQTNRVLGKCHFLPGGGAPENWGIRYFFLDQKGDHLYFSKKLILQKRCSFDSVSCWNSSKRG